MATQPNKRKTLRSRLQPLLSDRFIFPSALGLVLFSLAYWVIYPALISRGDLVKFGGVVIAIVLLGLCALLFSEYIIRQAKVSKDTSRNIALISAINVFTGISLPLYIATLVLGSMVKLLNHMSNQQTFWCELRRNFVSFYYQNGVYYNMMSIFMLTIVVIILLVTLGSVWEKVKR